MTPPMLRQFWSVIEHTQTAVLLGLDDRSLVNWLLNQLKEERSLDAREADIFSHYIQSRLNLIRDLAQAR